LNLVFLYAGEILPERGGVQRVSSVLADYFEAKGINVFYLSLAKNELSSSSSSRQYFFPSSNNIEKNTLFLHTFLKTKEIDILINQSGISPEVSAYAYKAREINVKVISVVHNSILTGIKNFSSLYKTKAQKLNLDWLLPIADKKIVNKFLLFLYKIKYKKHYSGLCMKSDIVILLSGKFREELNYITGDRGNYSNILSIPNPISFIPEVVNLRNKKKELLYVGRIDTLYKRVDLLLEIWNKVYARFPDWELKIVGGGGEMEDVIKMAESLRLQRVSFEGFQNPISYYRDASIFCMTSSSESFGMVLLEAMQYSVVPIAFNSYVSVTDIIDDGENGILIKPFNCESYIKELISLMSEKSRCDIIAEKAQEKSMQFSIEKVGSVWVSVFENLMLSK